jgi:signal transduction histidine kinase
VQWWERATRWSDVHQFPVDAATTAGLLLLTVPTATLLQGGQTTLLHLWAFAIVVPLAWRRVRPVASVVAVYSVGLLHILVGVPLVVPADLAVLVALFSVTVYGPRWAYRTAILSAMAGASVVSLAIMLEARGFDPGSAAFSTVFIATAALATWAFGLVRRSRRETITALVDRAERLEVERDQQVRIAIAAERSRISREMHDIVAHSLSVIIAQADGGRYAAETEPNAAIRSLATIGETGRSALADMRRLLGVLRRSGDVTDGNPATIPLPAVDDLETLVEQVRASGLRVSLVRMGAPRALPPGTGLTAYRICQEALTNVLKHAGPDPSVTTLVHWLPAALVIEVSDDGRGAAAITDGAGRGLLGMRERAAMFGGTVMAGPRPGGGFWVRAEIPLPTNAVLAPEVTTPYPSEAL